MKGLCPSDLTVKVLDVQCGRGKPVCYIDFEVHHRAGNYVDLLLSARVKNYVSFLFWAQNALQRIRHRFVVLVHLFNHFSAVHVLVFHVRLLLTADCFLNLLQPFELKSHSLIHFLSRLSHVKSLVQFDTQAIGRILNRKHLGYCGWALGFLQRFDWSLGLRSIEMERGADLRKWVWVSGVGFLLRVEVDHVPIDYCSSWLGYVDCISIGNSPAYQFATRS